MKKRSLVLALTLSALLPSAALAQADCHQDMKEMLQGTLDMAKQADVEKSNDDGSDACTLADWQGRPGSVGT